MLSQEQIARLRAPFPAQDVQWRAGATNANRTRALALAYIDARAVMDRLDEVVGPMNWTDAYEEWKVGAVKAGIGIRDAETGEWIWKYDGADDTDFEATKGGLSDAFKRAAVKWGIGRYLYRLPAVWVACRQRGGSVVLEETPELPAWALPDDSQSPAGVEPPSRQRKRPREETLAGTYPEGVDKLIRKMEQTGWLHDGAFHQYLSDLIPGYKPRAPLSDSIGTLTIEQAKRINLLLDQQMEKPAIAAARATV